MKKFAKIMAVALVAVMALAVLVACAPASDPDKAVSALKKHDYSASSSKLLLGSLLSVMGIENVKTVVVGTKIADDKIETVTIVYFTSPSAANEAWTDLQAYGMEQKDKNSNSAWTCEKSGAMIYWGTKNAVNAAH